MYAIIQIGAKQFRVEKGGEITVDRLADNIGDIIKHKNVLLLRDDKAVTIGEPDIKGAVVELCVKRHSRGKKVVALRFKKGSGNQTKTGSRSDQTVLEVKEITV